MWLQAARLEHSLYLHYRIHFSFCNDTSHLFFVLFFVKMVLKKMRKKYDNDGFQWPVAMATLLYWSSQPSSPFTFAFTLTSLILSPFYQSLFSYSLHPGPHFAFHLSAVFSLRDWCLVPMLTFTWFEHTFCSSVPICQIKSTTTCLIHKHIYSEFKS